MDGAGSSSTLSFDDCIEAKRRGPMRKASGRDGMPAELLASCEPAVGAQVSSLCWRRIAGEGVAVSAHLG